jgi:hypothetical protein
MKSPRERAARALCRLDGNPEDATYQGRPMWMSYLLEVDAVLGSALDDRTWLNIKLQGPFTGS